MAAFTAAGGTVEFDMSEARRNVPVLLLALAVYAVGFLLFFWQRLLPLWALWNTEDFSYCPLLPFVSIYFVYRNWADIMATPRRGYLIGSLCIVAAVCLSLVGVLGSLEMLIFLAMWLAACGAMFLIFTDANWRNLMYPVILLAFAVPFPPFLSRMLSFQLRLVSSQLSVDFLNNIGVPALQDGNIIDLGYLYKLEVVDACSGLRYFFPMLIMAIIVGAMFHRTLRDRIALFVISPVVAVFANVVRIVLTALIMKLVSPEYTVGVYHDMLGFLVYFVSLPTLLLASQGLHRIFRDVPPAPQAPAQAAVVPEWRVPAMYLAGFALLLLVTAPLQRHLDGNFIIPQRKTFADFPMQIGDWQGKRLYLEAGEAAGLGADDYMLASFINTKTGNQLQLLIPYYQQQTIAHTAHAPASCLLGSGWFIEHKQEQPASTITQRLFSIHQMVMTKDDGTMLSNFWFEQRGRHITDEFWNKIYMFWDAMTMRRSDGALVRAEMFLRPNQSVDDGQKILDPFLVEVRKLLPAYVPGREAKVASHAS